MAVSQDGMALEFVDKKLQTADLCKEDVLQNGFALEFVDKKLQTPEICIIALKKNINYAKYIICAQQLKKIITTELEEI